MSVRQTNIGWADFSGGDLNFVIGCTPVSEGCVNCYARRLIEERQGRDFSEVRFYPDKLRRLLTARFETHFVPFRRGPGSRPIAFPVDLGDLFHERLLDTTIVAALEVMQQRCDVDFVLLTKRIDRARRFDRDYGPLPNNVWLGVTVENDSYLWRVGELLQIRVAVRLVSLEPMLGPMDLRPYLVPQSFRWCGARPALDWVIAGAESGPRRRPFEVAWAEDVWRQCEEAGVPFFGKQDSGGRPGVPLLVEGQEVKEFPR